MTNGNPEGDTPAGDDQKPAWAPPSWSPRPTETPGPTDTPPWLPRTAPSAEPRPASATPVRPVEPPAPAPGAAEPPAPAAPAADRPAGEPPAGDVPPWERRTATPPAAGAQTVRPQSSAWSPPGTALPIPSEGSETVLLTVVAPSGGRTTTRVSADVPLSQLAAALGAAVAVANVSELTDEAGRPLPPESTLAAAGLTPTATVRVVAPGRSPGGAPAGPALASSAQTTAAPAPTPTRAAAPAATPRPWEGAPTGSSRAGTGAGGPGRALIAAAAAALVVVAVVAFVIGHATGGSTTPAAGPGPIATQAGQAWLAGRPFTGPRQPGVPVALGRFQPLAGGKLQPISQWHHGTAAGETFVVSGGPVPFALTVVFDGGRLAFAPTAGPLPPVQGQAVPASPAHPGGAGALPSAVTQWATAVFGAKGLLTPILGLGQAGDLRASAAWTPAKGGTVYRVTVPLGSLAPGTTDGNYSAAYQAATAKVAADEAAAAAAATADTQAQAASKAAAGASAAANPANPALLAAAMAAGAAATAAVQKADVTAAAYAADQAALAKSPKPTATATTAIGTYDVWMRAQSVIGWQPAGYGFTG